MQSKESENSKKSKWSNWALRLIGVVIFVGIFIKIDKNALLAEFTSIKWHFVIIAAVLCAAHFCVKALRWRYILRLRGIWAPRLKTITNYCAGSLIGALTPGRIGELSKVLSVRSWRSDSTWGTAFGTVVLDRIVDVLALAFVAVLGTLWFGVSPEFHLKGVPAILIIIALGLAVCWYLGKLFCSSVSGKKIIERLKLKLGDTGKDFWEALKEGTGKNSWFLILWTLFAYILFFLHFLALGKAVASDISPSVLIWAISLASLGAILPISISGIGVRDYILIQIFIAWGGSSSEAFAVSLLYLGVFNVVVALMGIWPFVLGDFDITAIRRRRDF